MKKRTLFLIGTAAAAGIYSAITGKGLFNKPRFKEQHERVANYVETHYPPPKNIVKTSFNLFMVYTLL